MFIISVVLVSFFLLSHLYLWHCPKSFWEMALSLYYRRIHFYGHIKEEDTATIVVANHSNAFIDPFALEAALNRPLIRTVRADWLQHWLVKWFARLLGAVPLAQAKTNPGQSNRGSFQALNDALQKGRWVVVFPEGVSHNRHRLHPFKNGAAHLARQYIERTGKPIRVVQLSLYYDDKSRIGSDVRVQLAGIDYYDDQQQLQYPSEISQSWQQQIQAQLPQANRTPLKRRLNWLQLNLEALHGKTESLSGYAPNWLSCSQVSQFKAWLQVTGFDLGVLNRHASRSSQALRLICEAVTFVFGLPLALVGLMLHGPAIILHYLLIRQHAHGEDKWASNAYVIGTPLYTVYWAILATLFGPLMLVLPALGIYALFYWRSWEQRKRAMLTTFHCLSKPSTRQTILSLAREVLDPVRQAEDSFLTQQTSRS